MFDLATLLVKVAKHWVKVAPDARLQGYARNLRPDAKGLGTKNRQRLAPLRDERNLVRLFLLPGKICKAIEAKPRQTRKGALLMQHAVALMILTYAPIRIGNLAALRCDVNLRWSNAHKKGSLIIDVDGHDVKNRQTLTFPLPDGCAAMIRTYIEVHLPLLAAGGNAYLFPSDVPRRPKRSDTLGEQLSKLIRRTIGLEVNPHLYRHLVHLVVLNRYPGAYALISRCSATNRFRRRFPTTPARTSRSPCARSSI